MSARLEMEGQAAFSKHEKVLFSPEPAYNREEREEVLLQNQLDSGTEEQKEMLIRKHRHLQTEINRINRTIDVKFAELIGDTPGLKVINPAIEGQHGVGGVGGRAPVGPLVARPSTQFSTSPSSSTSLGWCLKAGRALPPASHRRGPPIPGQAMSNYAIAFPVPYDESGFNSVVRWADVCFEETVVAALGPGVDAEKTRQMEMPHRVLVTVTCYLLNEVLCRDPNVKDLWLKLKAPILDAVFSPNMIAAEMAKRQQRLHRKPQPKTIGALLRNEDERNVNRGGVGIGYLDGPLPPPSYQIEEAQRQKALDEREDGVLEAFPIRYVNYDNPHDYASYCLWTEELLNAKRMNDRMAERVEQLKEVVMKSRLVLDMAGRRVDRYRKQALFSAWKTYTERMRRFRQTATVYITNARKRQLIESSFLKWRRVPLQEKVANLQMEVMELRRKLQMVQETHSVEVATLKGQNREAADQLQDMTLKDEALRNQMMESHRIETTGLRTALTKATQGVSQLTKHARRWQRLAKTLRPQVLCRSVPKPLMLVALELKHVEEDALGSANLPAIHQQVARSCVTLLEQLLLKWVNFVMMSSPQKRTWVQAMSFARHVSAPSQGAGGVAAPQGPAAHLLAPLPDGSDPALFGPAGLLQLVRELRRLQWPESPDLAQELEIAASGGKGNSGAEGPLLLDNISGSSRGSSPSLGGTTMTSQAAASPIALYQELSELLHYYSSEGFTPSLLLQCPFLDVFYNPHSLSHLTNTICMLWVLSALFIGYVNKMVVLEAMLGTTPKTSYLRNRCESAIARRPHPSLNGVIPQEYLNVPPSTWDDVAVSTGSYVTSNVTIVRKNNNNSPSAWDSSPGTSNRLTPPSPNTGGGGSGLGGALNLTRNITFRVTDFNEVDLVRDRTDTGSDLEVFLGNREEDLPQSDDDYDMEEIMLGMVREEEKELQRRRRQREEQLQSGAGASSSRPGSDGTNANAGEEEAEEYPFVEGEGVDAEGNNTYDDGASAWHPASSLGLDEEDDEANDESGGVVAVASYRKPFYWEKDDENYAGLRDVQKPLLDLEAQIIKERKRHAAQAAAFLMKAKEDILSVEQVQFLHLIPRPSKAFDLTIKKPQFKTRKKRLSLNRRGSRRGTQLNVSGSASGAMENDDPRIIRRKARRVSVLTFLKRLIMDNVHRQQWIGVARVVTSLICRVRVLDYGHGVPNRKWGEGRSENLSPFSMTKRIAASGNSNPGTANRGKSSNGKKSTKKKSEDDSFLYSSDAHLHVGGQLGNDLSAKRVSRRSGELQEGPSTTGSSTPRKSSKASGLEERKASAEGIFTQDSSKPSGGKTKRKKKAADDDGVVDGDGDGATSSRIHKTASSKKAKRSSGVVPLVGDELQQMEGDGRTQAAAEPADRTSVSLPSLRGQGSGTDHSSTADLHPAPTLRTKAGATLPVGPYALSSGIDRTPNRHDGNGPSTVSVDGASSTSGGWPGAPEGSTHTAPPPREEREDSLPARGEATVRPPRPPPAADMNRMPGIGPAPGPLPTFSNVPGVVPSPPSGGEGGSFAHRLPGSTENLHAPSMSAVTLGTGSFPPGMGPLGSRPPTLDMTHLSDPSAMGSRCPSGSIPIAPTLTSDGKWIPTHMSYTLPQHALDPLTLHVNLQQTVKRPPERFNLKDAK